MTTEGDFCSCGIRLKSANGSTSLKIDGFLGYANVQLYGDACYDCAIAEFRKKFDVCMSEKFIVLNNGAVEINWELYDQGSSTLYNEVLLAFHILTTDQEDGWSIIFKSDIITWIVLDPHSAWDNYYFRSKKDALLYANKACKHVGGDRRLVQFNRVLRQDQIIAAG